MKKVSFFSFCKFLRSYAKTDVTSNFLDIFSSRLTFSELGATLGGHLGIGYRTTTLGGVRGVQRVLPTLVRSIDRSTRNILSTGTFQYRYFEQPLDDGVDSEDDADWELIELDGDVYGATI